VLGGSPLLIGVIFVGGGLGTLARAVLEDAAPARPGAGPWTTLAINVVGSLLLGLLLETLARTGPDEGWRRTARLGLGTGVLGGFTTYSTFAVETVDRLTPQTLLVGIAYAVGSVVSGVAAAAVGYRLARGLRRSTTEPGARR
jgi:CrcB protein